MADTKTINLEINDKKDDDKPGIFRRLVSSLLWLVVYVPVVVLTVMIVTTAWDNTTGASSNRLAEDLMYLAAEMFLNGLIWLLTVLGA